MKISPDELVSLQRMVRAKDEATFELANHLIRTQWSKSSAVLIMLQKTLKNVEGDRYNRVYSLAAMIWSR